MSIRLPQDRCNEKIELKIDPLSVDSGGYGDVYKAFYDGKTYALKIVRVAISTENIKHIETAEEKSLLREIIASNKLQSSKYTGNVNYFGIVEIDGVRKFAIVSEYIHGQNLKDFLKNRLGLTEEEKLVLMFGILNGLADIHSCGIVHRDLSPRNIIVDTEKVPKIIDFGISYFLEVTHSLSITQRDTSKHDFSGQGKAKYMAPEQWKPDNYGLKRDEDGLFPIRKESDIFSFGIIAYEIVYGMYPFAGTNTESFRVSILQDTVKLGSKLGIDLLINACLEKDYRLRPDVNKLSTAIEEIRKNRYPIVLVNKSKNLRDKILSLVVFIAVITVLLYFTKMLIENRNREKKYYTAIEKNNLELEFLNISVKVSAYYYKAKDELKISQQEVKKIEEELQKAKSNIPQGVIIENLSHATKELKNLIELSNAISLYSSLEKERKQFEGNINDSKKISDYTKLFERELKTFFSLNKIEIIIPISIKEPEISNFLDKGYQSLNHYLSNYSFYSSLEYKRNKINEIITWKKMCIDYQNLAVKSKKINDRQKRNLKELEEICAMMISMYEAKEIGEFKNILEKIESSKIIYSYYQNYLLAYINFLLFRQYNQDISYFNDAKKNIKHCSKIQNEDEIQIRIEPGITILFCNTQLYETETEIKENMIKKDMNILDVEDIHIYLSTIEKIMQQYEKLPMKELINSDRMLNNLADTYVRYSVLNKKLSISERNKFLAKALAYINVAIENAPSDLYLLTRFEIISSLSVLTEDEELWNLAEKSLQEFNQSKDNILRENAQKYLKKVDMGFNFGVNPIISVLQEESKDKYLNLVNSILGE